jgi:hypothetical protein
VINPDRALARPVLSKRRCFRNALAIAGSRAGVG